MQWLGLRPWSLGASSSNASASSSFGGSSSGSSSHGHNHGHSGWVSLCADAGCVEGGGPHHPPGTSPFLLHCQVGGCMNHAPACVDFPARAIAPVLISTFSLVFFSDCKCSPWIHARTHGSLFYHNASSLTFFSCLQQHHRRRHHHHHHHHQPTTITTGGGAAVRGAETGLNFCVLWFGAV